MDPIKIDAIPSWEKPQNVKDVQDFLSFANFYRRFIKDFAKLAAPLTALTRKNQKFIWKTKEENSFYAIETAFISGSILQHFDLEKECVVETEASDYVSYVVLS